MTNTSLALKKRRAFFMQSWQSWSLSHAKQLYRLADWSAIYQSGRTPLLQTWLYISWFFTYTVSVFYLKSAQLQSENILNFTRQQIQLHPVIFWQISYSHSSHFSISVLNPKPRGAHQTFCWMSPRHMMLWIKAGAKRILLLCPSTSSHWSFDC